MAAAIPVCPEDPVAATLGPGDRVTVWFEHARATLLGDKLDILYFPTASFAPSGGI